MTFLQAIDRGFKRYIDFHGRSHRAEFWYWMLFCYVGCIAIILLARGIAQGIGAYLLFLSIIFIPTLAVLVRRLHDINKSGWWILMPMASETIVLGVVMVVVCAYIAPGQSYPLSEIPTGHLFLLSGLVLIALAIYTVFIVWLCRKGDESANHFGDAPRLDASP